MLMCIFIKYPNCAININNILFINFKIINTAEGIAQDDITGALKIHYIAPSGPYNYYL